MPYKPKAKVLCIALFLLRAEHFLQPEPEHRLEIA